MKKAKPTIEEQDAASERNLKIAEVLLTAHRHCCIPDGTPDGNMDWASFDALVGVIIADAHHASHIFNAVMDVGEAEGNEQVYYEAKEIAARLVMKYDLRFKEAA